MYYLDPTVEDLPVNMETLQSALKKWVVDVMTQNANSESQLDLSTLQFQFDQSKFYFSPLWFGRTSFIVFFLSCECQLILILDSPLCHLIHQGTDNHPVNNVSLLP